MTINEILGPILTTAGESLALDDSPDTIQAWDSVKHLDVILAVEEAIGAELSAHEISKLNSIRQIVELFRAHGIEVTL